MSEKRDLRIQTDRFKVADFSLGKFDAKVEIGTTREDLLKQEFWSHVSEQMTPYSEITARCDDGTFYAKYLVLDCGRGWAKVQELNWWNLTTKDVAQTQSAAGSMNDFEIIWKGGTRKHIVQRKSDGVVMQEGLQRKEAATDWLKDHLAKRVSSTVPEPS